jgi:hypothetical protein
MGLEEFRYEAARLPFEPAISVVSLMSSRIWPIWTDGSSQVNLAKEMWGEIPLVEIYRSFVARHPGGVPFSQQQTAIVQRVLLDYAREASLEEVLTQDEILGLTRLLVHAHDLVDASHASLDRDQANLMELLAYVMQVGAYYERPALLNTFGRSYDLFLQRARARADEALPLDEWSVDDYKSTLEEQLAGGFGFAAAAHAFDDDPEKTKVVLNPEVLSKTALAERETVIAGVLTADRDWFREQFAAGDQSMRDIAWEITPFLRRPFLRLSTDQTLLLSPVALNYWVSQGFYDRLRECAKERRTRRDDKLSQYGAFSGELVEDYCLELVTSVYQEGRVHGDQPYGKGGGLRTPDIAIDHGKDVVLIEVRSGVLSPWFRTSGAVDEFEKQLDRLVLRKMGQLGNRIADLRRGTAAIPGIDFAKVRRIWPILATASLTMNELFYDWVQDRRPAALKDPAVQPLFIIDIEDLEILAGLIEAGNDLIEMLESWQSGPFGKLELKRWVLEELDTPSTTRAAHTTQRWNEATEGMKQTLGWG